MSTEVRQFLMDFQYGIGGAQVVKDYGKLKCEMIDK